jgi:hypothetical protein
MQNSTRPRLESIYIALAVIGFLTPGIPMFMESWQTGNWLFWAMPARTMSELFVNRTTTAFALDLFATVIVAYVWITMEARRIGMRGVWRFWLLIAVFGLAGPLPLFLWYRERVLARAADARTGRQTAPAQTFPLPH